MAATTDADAISAAAAITISRFILSSFVAQHSLSVVNDSNRQSHRRNYSNVYGMSAFTHPGLDVAIMFASPDTINRSGALILWNEEREGGSLKLVSQQRLIENWPVRENGAWNLRLRYGCHATSKGSATFKIPISGRYGILVGIA